MLTPHTPAAYVDGSALLAIALEESGWETVAQRLNSFTALFSSTLLEAEVRAAYARERREFNPHLLDGIRWVFPVRPLSNEIEAVLQARYLRSGDLLHVATALYAASDLNVELAFITLDANQQQAADALGFPA